MSRCPTRLFPACLVALLFVAACTEGTAGMSEQPLGLEVEMSNRNPLQGEARFTTSEDKAPTVEITDETGRGVAVTPRDSTAGPHAIPILGVRSDSSYTVTVEAEDAEESQTIETKPLPGRMPPIEVEKRPERMSPGLTLFDASPLEGGANDGHLVVVDAEGEVVWYYRQTHSIQDARRTSDGDFLFINHETGVRRLDPATGEIVEFSGRTGLEDAPVDDRGRAYAGPDAIPVDTDQMHHEVIELPNGNLMTLSREARTIEGFPDDICDEGEAFDGSYVIGADTVVEFTTEGSVVAEWPLLDLIHPLESLESIRPSSFCGSYLDPVYPDMEARDWTHANAVVLDEARNVVWVSVRHLDQLLAIRYTDDPDGPAGELVWRLGKGGDFTLEEGEWFLHQHAPQILDDGRILVYDNGNHREGTSFEDPQRQPYSRAVIYEVDTDHMTARQVWESRLDTPDEPVYAPFVGDADMLEGTVLVTHGGQTDPPTDDIRGEGVTVWGRIAEVDYDDGDVVFDLRVREERGSGWRIYRAERIPTLYPAGYQVEPIEP